MLNMMDALNYQPSMVLDICAVTDVFQNCVQLTTTQLLVNDDDHSSPFITAFTYDQDAAELAMYFSEPIDVDSLRLSLLSIQSSRSTSERIDIANASAITQLAPNFVRFLLDGTILLDAGVGSSQGTTYLSAQPAAVYDMAAPPNPLVSIPSTAALQEGPTVDQKTAGLNSCPSAQSRELS